MKTRQNKAYTLVEVMMTVLIFAMIMGGLYAGLIAGGRSWQVYDAKALTQREARRVFVTLNRDLRMARGLIFKKKDKNTVVFSFQHPDQGLVTYAWSRPDTVQGGPVTRSHADSVWVIARHISAFQIIESADGIRFSVAAVSPEGRRSSQEFRLTGQVKKR